MTIFEKVRNVQVELKAPKNLYNSFGKYNYRNAESILEALKPLESKWGITTIIDDDLIVIGGRFYVKATVTVYDSETGEKVTASAYAREDESKKGMDGSQVTGSSSSYARKYALNGMFLLDDTKDADTDEYHNQNTSAKATAPKANTKPKNDVRKQLVDTCGLAGISVREVCDKFGINNDSSDDEFKKAIDYVRGL